jgi:hypothetical protein
MERLTVQPLITGFRKDADGDWIADLDCGHQRHVRHNPPWENRPWVLHEESRRAHVGTPLHCGLCDAEAERAFRDAKLQGLCDDGAAEAARSRE